MGDFAGYLLRHWPVWPAKIVDFPPRALWSPSKLQWTWGIESSVRSLWHAMMEPEPGPDRHRVQRHSPGVRTRTKAQAPSRRPRAGRDCESMPESEPGVCASSLPGHSDLKNCLCTNWHTEISWEIYKNLVDFQHTLFFWDISKHTERIYKDICITFRISDSISYIRIYIKDIYQKLSKILFDVRQDIFDIYTDIWNWIWYPKGNTDIFIYCSLSPCVLIYLRKNKICWKSTRCFNISQDISVCHLVQRHIVMVTVAGQARSSDSRLWFRHWLAVTASPKPPIGAWALVR